MIIYLTLPLLDRPSPLLFISIVPPSHFPSTPPLCTISPLSSPSLSLHQTFPTFLLPLTIPHFTSSSYLPCLQHTLILPYLNPSSQSIAYHSVPLPNHRNAPYPSRCDVRFSTGNKIMYMYLNSR